jgi:hypothetical protein
MENNLVENFLKQTQKNIILDTNIFLLLLIGLEDKNIIKKMKPTKMFSPDDFEKLKSLISQYKTIRTTPHILTEFSNLNNKKYYYREKLFNRFYFLINRGYLIEESVDISKIISDEKTTLLGIADIGMKILSSEKDYGVITADLELYLILSSKNIPCLNFNHLIN